MTPIVRCRRAWRTSDCLRRPRRRAGRKLENSRHLPTDGAFREASRTGSRDYPGHASRRRRHQEWGFARISVLESDDGSGTGCLPDAARFDGGDLGLSRAAELSPPLSEKRHLLAPPSHPMRCPREEGSSVEQAAVMCQPAKPDQKTRAIDGFFFQKLGEVVP